MKLINVLKKMIKIEDKWILPSSIYTPIENAVRLRFDPQFKDNYVQYKSFGELNPDKTFYVLRYDFPKAGIFTVCFDFLPQFEWAEMQGYIPIVDMKNYKLPLWGTEEEDNLWELYFQPVSCDISLEEVYESKNVILGWKNGMAYKNPFTRPDWNRIETYSKDSIERWGKVFNRYIILNSNIIERVDEFYDQNMKGKRILGVVMRECYRWCALVKPELGYGHPILLTPEQSIQQSENYMREWQCSYIFLLSDDEECALKFREYFGDRCILYDRLRSVFFKQEKPVIGQSPTFNIKERSSDYLIEIELLSRCTAIFSGITSGTGVALIRNQGKYEHVEIYDKGVYHFEL